MVGPGGGEKLSPSPPGPGSLKDRRKNSWLRLGTGLLCHPRAGPEWGFHGAGRGDCQQCGGPWTDPGLPGRRALGALPTGSASSSRGCWDPPHPPFLKEEKGRIRSWRGEAGSQTQPGTEQPGSPPSVAALERGGRASVSRGPARTRDAGPTGVGDFCGSRGAELEPGPGSHRTADSAPRRSELPIRGGIQAGLAVGRFPRHTVMGPGLLLGRTGSSDYTSGIDP